MVFNKQDMGTHQRLSQVSFFSDEKQYIYQLKLAWHPFCGTKANSIAPDMTPQKAASHLGLFCLLENFH